MNHLSQLKKNILENFSYLIVSEIIMKFFSVIAIVYLARVLLPSGFGKLNFAIAIISYFFLFSNLGLDVIGVREVSHKSKQIKYIIDFSGYILELRLILFLISLVILCSILLVVNISFVMKVLLFLYLLNIFPQMLLLDWVFKGIQKMKYIPILKLIIGFTYLLMVLVFIKCPSDLLKVPLLILIAHSFGTIYLIRIYNKNIGNLQIVSHYKHLKKLFLESLPLGLTGFLNLIIFNIDTIMIAYFLSDNEVGYYNAGYKIILLFIGIILSYFEAIFPVISKNIFSKIDTFFNTIEITIKLIFIILFPVCLLIFHYSDRLYSIIYGKEYIPGTTSFSILIWSVFFLAFANIFVRSLIAYNKQKIYLASLSAVALFNIIFNIFLIPNYGINGAAFATVLTEILSLIIHYIIFNKYISFPKHICKLLLKGLIAAETVFIALFFLDSIFNHLINFLILFIIYFILLYCFNFYRFFRN